MGQFAFANDPVEIPPNSDIVLQRLPLVSGDSERFKLHRAITYTSTDAATGEVFSYSVPPTTRSRPISHRCHSS